MKRIKHAPARETGSAARGDVYVSRRSHEAATARRAERVLAEDGCVTLHALGAAVPLAMRLALRLRDATPHSALSVETSSVALVDELLPTAAAKDDDEDDDDDALPGFETRINSAIHIRITAAATEAKKRKK